MKKSILIFSSVLIALSLTALGIANWNEPMTDIPCSDVVDEEPISQEEDVLAAREFEFFYDVDTRFRMTITKQDLHALKSVSAFVPEQDRLLIRSYDSVRVTILDDVRHTDLSYTGKSGVLTEDQLELLHSVDYSTNLFVRVDFQMEDGTGVSTYGNYSTPHITVVPEKQAVYIAGKDALLSYLKVNSVYQTAIAREGNLLAGKIYFTVDTFGMVSSIHLASSSGFPSIDQHMTDLISRAPGKWQPAENEKGERVNQTLVYSFGIMGC